MPEGLLLDKMVNMQGDMFTQGFNILNQSILNKNQQKFAVGMYNAQRRDSIADWNMQNEYNSPTSQMARLKAAGLNPHLVYGSGATTTAPPVRSSSQGSYSPRTSEVSNNREVGSMLGMYDLKLKEAQINNLQAATTVQLEERALKEAQKIATLQGVEGSKFSLRKGESLLSYELEAAGLHNEKTKADTRYTLDQNERAAAMNASSLLEAAERILHSRVSRSKSQHEIHEIEQRILLLKKDERLKQLDIELKEKGIQPGDPIYMRVLGRVVNEGWHTLVAGSKASAIGNQLMHMPWY